MKLTANYTQNNFKNDQIIQIVPDTIIFITYNIVSSRNLNNTLVKIEMASDLITFPITIDSKEYLTKL